MTSASAPSASITGGLKATESMACGLKAYNALVDDESATGGGSPLGKAAVE